MIFQEAKRNGYGSAIKLGFQNSKFKRICFFPIDDQYDAEELVEILNNSNSSNIITFRKSSYNGYFRKIQSNIFKKITKVLLNLKFTDINSLKIISKKHFENFSRFSNNWNIDLEILIYIQKNNISCKVVNCKTIREIGGLAYSSRNILLTKYEKELASKIYKFIKNNKKKFIKKKDNLSAARKAIIKLGAVKIDYINILDTNKIFKIGYKKPNWKIFIAYYLREIRLIDNI